MTTPPEVRETLHDTRQGNEARGHGHLHQSHGWMMWLMCLPMVAFVIVLMFTSASAAALIPAILCVGMMALMMGMMHRGH